jgi:hypothetical protein
MVTLYKKRFNIDNYPYYAHTKHWLVLYGTKDKELTFSHRKLAIFLAEMGCVYSVVRTGILSIIQVNRCL